MDAEGTNEVRELFVTAADVGALAQAQLEAGQLGAADVSIESLLLTVRSALGHMREAGAASCIPIE